MCYLADLQDLESFSRGEGVVDFEIGAAKKCRPPCPQRQAEVSHILWGSGQRAVQTLLRAPHPARQLQGVADLFEIAKDFSVGVVVPFGFDVLVKEHQAHRKNLLQPLRLGNCESCASPPASLHPRLHTAYF